MLRTNNDPLWDFAGEENRLRLAATVGSSIARYRQHEAAGAAESRCAQGSTMGSAPYAIQAACWYLDCCRHLTGETVGDPLDILCYQPFRATRSQSDYLHTLICNPRRLRLLVYLYTPPWDCLLRSVKHLSLQVQILVRFRATNPPKWPKRAIENGGAPPHGALVRSS